MFVTLTLAEIKHAIFMLERLEAFALHLLVSILIALLAAGLVFFIWYPAPLHTAADVTSIFLLLLAIDVILGPILSLLVYKPGKKTLVMDISVIALLQLSALAYGLYTVADGRPAWLVFAKDRFEMVRIPEIDERKLDEAAAEYRIPSWSGPKWVAAKAPFSSEENNQILFEAVAGGPDIAQRPHLYQPLARQNEAIRQQARPLSALAAFNPTKQIQQLLNLYPTANGWLPLKASAQDMTVLVNTETAAVIAIVDLRPWD